MAEPAARRMTVDEFFAWQAEQEHNYELVDGVPVMTVKAMTGATAMHDRITVNAIGTLFQQLRGKPCRPKTADTSVRTIRGTRRPDITIECGKPGPRDMAADEPRVVIEVLSPMPVVSEDFVRHTEYCNTSAIKAIVYLDTEAPRGLMWRRMGPGWLPVGSFEGLDAAIDLPEIEATLPMSELYLGVEFRGEASAPRL
jgi:Uma2 family endonuclease